MGIDIKCITLRSVNCYLVKDGTGYTLIDSSWSGKRKDLERELESFGCKPGNLKLVILTHGDFDHCGNAAYFQANYNAKTAMHSGDLGMVQNRDMFQGRKQSNLFVKKAAQLMFKKEDSFTPDIILEDGSNLSDYGFSAKVIHTPGHSAGSVCILAENGSLFCGDLLVNGDKPSLNNMIDDMEEAKLSVQKLARFNINTVYPGHGKPFLMSEFTNP